MAKQSKATKKFEKNHLKGTLDRRKDFAKIKQRHQLKAKKKQKAAQRAEKEKDGRSDDEDSSALPDTENLDEDDFFQEPIQIPEHETTKSQNKSKRKREKLEADEVSKDDSSSISDEELGGHKEQLAGLASKDPEFFKYLQENDAELLDFDDEDDLAETSLLSDDGEEERSSKKRKQDEDDNVSGPEEVTSELIEKWKTSMIDQHSIRSLRQLVLAFRAAAHTNDDAADTSKFSIPNSEIYHQILVTALQQIPTVLAYHLPVKESASGKTHFQSESPKFKQLSPLIRSYTSSMHYLLSNLSDTATTRLTLQAFEPLLPYLLQLRKSLKVMIKLVAGIWCDSSAAEATRITAFLIVRKLMVIGDAGIREKVLKSTYEGVVKGSLTVNSHTLPGINLMKNSAVEIWGIDQKISYTTGFTFIRQLAIHLRSNITKPTKDSYKTIYNWQFVHSLDFWSRVLSTYCNSLVEAESGKESELRPLIYPVVQITLGVMRLIPTSTYFPLRFQLMRSLLRISQATGTYIPLSSALLEVLNAAEMKKPAKPATLRPLDFSLHLRAPASYLKTRVYQDGVGEQVVELFAEFFVLWSKSIAFPELQLPVTVMLKRWLKTASKPTGNKNAKLNQALLLLIQKSESNSKWIEERRNQVTFAPKDRTEVEAFLRDVSWEETPMGAFVVGQRKVREERARVLEQGRREEEQKRKSHKNEDKMNLE